MKKLLLTILVSLMWSNISIAEEKDNSHLQNNFDTYPSCEEHVGVLFKKKYSPRDYPYLFPENKLVSCNPEINLPNEWAKTITPIKKFAKVRLDNANIRAYPFVGSHSGFHVGNLNIGEVIFIDSLVYNSLEKVDGWYRSWYSFKVDGKIFYIWKDSVEFDYKDSEEQQTSAYEIGEEVFLNACTPNPDKYYDKPLNIKDILIEVPNKISNLKKSKYNREFQTLATSTIDLGNNKIDISISNFRDLTIKNSAGEVLEERKISGASSIYELKHKDKIVAWGVGWHKNCKEYYSDIDFTVLRIFVPIKKDNKVTIQQTVVSLNLSETYKATSNSDNLILAHAEEIWGSSRASTYYYEGIQFFEIDNQNDLKPIVNFEELDKKINIDKLNPGKIIITFAKYNEFQLLQKYTKENFDAIYNDLRNNYFWNFYYEWDDYPNVGPEFKKYLMEMEAKERLYEDIPPINDEEISNIKKICFSKDSYKDITDLVRNCYYWYSSLVLEVPKR